MRFRKSSRHYSRFDETYSSNVVHHKQCRVMTVEVDRRCAWRDGKKVVGVVFLCLDLKHLEHSPKARSRPSQLFLPDNTVSSGQTDIHASNHLIFPILPPPASFISDSYEPYHSAESSLLSHSRSLSSCPVNHISPQRQSRPSSLPHDTALICACCHR
jgi:hypothetical protein